MLIFGILGLIGALCVLSFFALVIDELDNTEIWFLAILDLVASWILGWELESMSSYIEALRLKRTWSVDISTVAV